MYLFFQIPYSHSFTKSSTTFYSPTDDLRSGEPERDRSQYITIKRESQFHLLYYPFNVCHEIYTLCWLPDPLKIIHILTCASDHIGNSPVDLLYSCHNANLPGISFCKQDDLYSENRLCSDAVVLPALLFIFG